MSDENLSVLNTKPDEMQASLERFKRSLPFFLEHAAVTAQIKFAYFAALKKQGFTDAQALELVGKGIGI